MRECNHRNKQGNQESDMQNNDPGFAEKCSGCIARASHCKRTTDDGPSAGGKVATTGSSLTRTSPPSSRSLPFPFSLRGTRCRRSFSCGRCSAGTEFAREAVIASASTDWRASESLGASKASSMATSSMTAGSRTGGAVRALRNEPRAARPPTLSRVTVSLRREDCSWHSGEM
jgi:hypothetical protein